MAYDDVDSGENVLTDDDKSEILRANDVNIDFNSSNEDLNVNSNHANNSGEDILGLTNQDNNMLNIAPETKLTASNEITVSIGNSVTIVFTLISIEESYYLYSWKCTLVDTYGENLMLKGWGEQMLRSGSFYTSDSGYFTVIRSIGKPSYSYISLTSYRHGFEQSSNFVLPSSLEVDTSVSVTNPSVIYNSGSFSVSGTETGMILC